MTHGNVIADILCSCGKAPVPMCPWATEVY